jgi:4-aminobutyrate aminotransferase-like enzyme
MGNGHPIAAVITTRRIADAFANGMEYFNTFGGNAVSCAAASAVLDVVEQENLQANAHTIGVYLLDSLNGLASKHLAIGNVRGVGLFLGIELVLDRESKAPATALASKVVDLASQRHVLLSTDGPHNNVIKIKPPMTFGRADANRLVMVLDQCLQLLS